MTNVADIVVNGADATGAPIDTVYARTVPIYAVYRTSERVMVHFADDDILANAQRTCLAQINPGRGEINGIIDGWRASHAPDAQSRTKLFDRRIADALVIALQGYPAQAAELLKLIKQDLVEERTSWARFEYLLYACGMAALLIVVLSFMTTGWFSRSIHPFAPEVSALWSAAAVGTLGAFFSIAIGIRNRTVLTDLQSWDNAADAVLRVVIGAIAAALLVCLLNSDLVQVGIGGKPIDGIGSEAWTLLLVIAFIGGFSERLVPDLLAKSTLAAVPAAGSTTPVTTGGLVPATAPVPAGGGAPPPPPPPGGGGDQSGATPTGPGPSGGSDTTTDPAAAEEEHVDGCVEAVELDEAEATQDVELPAARGGVERPLSPQS